MNDNSQRKIDGTFRTAITGSTQRELNGSGIKRSPEPEPKLKQVAQEDGFVIFRILPQQETRTIAPIRKNPAARFVP